MARDLFEIGEMPPLGQVPDLMYASLIRRERFGQPRDAFRTEVTDSPTAHTIPEPSEPPIWKSSC